MSSENCGVLEQQGSGYAQPQCQPFGPGMRLELSTGQSERECVGSSYDHPYTGMVRPATNQVTSTGSVHRARDAGIRYKKSWANSSQSWNAR
jgi:hypothetical protein